MLASRWGLATIVRRRLCRAIVDRNLCCDATFILTPSAALLPEFLRDRERINAQVIPPGGLVAGVVELPMMGATERYGELIAHLLAHGTRLHEAKVMRVGWGAAAEKAGLFADEEEMILVTGPSRTRDQECGVPCKRGEKNP